MRKTLIVAFSGGKTSAYMAHRILKLRAFKPFDVKFVFANTGKENEETLIFADRVDKAFGLNLIWLEAVTNPIYKKGVSAKVVTFETAARNGEPFEAMIAKHGMPNMNQSICSRELKTNLISSYAREVGWRGRGKLDYRAIGIRSDEVDRVNPNFLKDRIIYPLISHEATTREQVNLFWIENDFTLELKGYEGNCDLCYKKSLRKLLTVAHFNPEKLDWWEEMEGRYENFVPASRAHNPNLKLPIRFFRGNLSVKDLRSMAIDFKDFALDDSFDIPSGVRIKGIDIDALDGCSESCEAY